MLHYALYRLQLAHAVGQCILRRGGSDALFPNDFGEDLLTILPVQPQTCTAVLFMQSPVPSVRHV